jgi:1-aminocyclopropane-1-carboxylate deaminase
LELSSIDIQNIEAEWLTNKQLSLDVLRLDKLHPIVSGNKWFKLKYYLDEASTLKKTTIATFGGAWSNHIIATAFAAKEAGLKSIGIIRGEKPQDLSYTLDMAAEYGMELHFVTREQYRRKEEIFENYSHNNLYWIEEGGFGITGAKGAGEILKITDTSAYTYIIAAVGTGTMLAGLISSANSNQTIIGISSMKGNHSIEQKVKQLISNQAFEASFEINHDYHFGGYGKHPLPLIHFINEVYFKHNLPLDIIYTGKTFFAVKDLAEKSFFKPGSKLLMIHSGGLQGNMSLPVKVLAF